MLRSVTNHYFKFNLWPCSLYYGVEKLFAENDLDQRCANFFVGEPFTQPAYSAG